MEVKRGYKQTEVGVIPEEWEVAAIGNVFDISGGLSASREQLSTKGHCYLHYGDIHKSEKNFIDVRAEFLDIPKLDILLSRVPSKSLVADGDVVFVDASEDDEGTSKHVVVVNPEGIPYISGLHTIVAKSKTSSFDNNYKRYCFQTRDLKRQFYFYAVGTKVSGISKTNIKKVFISLPPLPEQHAIAEALSDADALIESLQQLIVKKRQIKQGAMQELLTGKKRLSGFTTKSGYKKTEVGEIPEDWEVLLLQDVVDFTNGKPHEGNVKSDGQYWLITLDSIGIDGRLKAEHKRTNTFDFSLKQNDIVSVLSDLAHGNLLGLCDLIPADNLYVLNQRMGRLRLKVPADARFIRLQINRRQGHFRKRGQGTSQKHIYRRDFDTMPIPFPAPPEQEAISTILSDMDLEIVALEEKVTKTKQLKQGMMQELLTGRIRLI